MLVVTIISNSTFIRSKLSAFSYHEDDIYSNNNNVYNNYIYDRILFVNNKIFMNIL